MNETLTNFIVYKLDHTGREVWQYPARVLEQGPNHVRLEAFFNRDDVDLGYTLFKRGDRFIESHYAHARSMAETARPAQPPVRGLATESG